MLEEEKDKEQRDRVCSDDDEDDEDDNFLPCFPLARHTFDQDPLKLPTNYPQL